MNDLLMKQMFFIISTSNSITWSIHGPSPITVYLTSNRTKSRLADRAIVDQIAVVSQVQIQCHQSTNKTLSKNIAWESHKTRSNVATKPTNEETHLLQQIQSQTAERDRVKSTFYSRGRHRRAQKTADQLANQDLHKPNFELHSFPFWKNLFSFDLSLMSLMSTARERNGKDYQLASFLHRGPETFYCCTISFASWESRRSLFSNTFARCGLVMFSILPLMKVFWGKGRRDQRPCGEVFSYKACLPRSWDTDYIACSILFIF